MRQDERNVRQPHPRRRAIRLRGYDYGQEGAYFVTICTRDRICSLGDVVDGDMVLSDAGRLAQATWQALPQHYLNVRLDAWVVMPNHVHGIVWLVSDGPSTQAGLETRPYRQRRTGSVGAGFKPARRGLPEIVRGFKTFSARRINAARNVTGSPFWQRNYYEHVIRSEDALDRIRQYIVDNPAKWHEDPENPNVTPRRR